ncbi:MAG: DUF1559 domain-containing protein [Gemmataceae bacterium]|nr:DUF1559 domain-containing protein [Gemmataceae bacterium]
MPPPYLADDEGRPMHSWRVLLLSFLEQQELFQQYDFSEPWDGPNNRKLADRMPQLFCFPGTHQPGNTMTNYFAVIGPRTAWPGSKKVILKDVKDGSSNTILIVESQSARIHWMEPRDLSFETVNMEKSDPAGVNSPYGPPAVAMLDGAVQSLNLGLKPATLRAMLTIDGGEELRHDEKEELVLLPKGREGPPNAK